MSKTRAEKFEGVDRWFAQREQRQVLKDLREYSEPYYRLYSTVRRSLERKTDEELKRLSSSEEHVSETNCAWVSYAVAPLVAHEARVILYARERSASEGET